MNISIEQNILVETVFKVSGPAAGKHNFPALDSVLIEAAGDKIKLTTTDLDITMIAILSAEVHKPGKVLIPFKQFMSVIKEFPQSKITLELIKNNLLITCEKVEFKINTLNINDFPKIESQKNTALIRIDPQELIDIIKLTSFCVGYEDTNYALRGILFEVYGGEVTGVSTDGKRMSVIKRKLPVNQPELKTKISFILPVKAVNEIQKVLKDKKEDIYFYTEKNKINFDLKDIKITVRPIEGEFPDYNQFIPQSSEYKMTINRTDLLSSLRRASLLSIPDYQSVIFDLDETNIVVRKTTPQIGEMKEKLDCTYTGKKFSIGFNPYYLIDVLKNLEDQRISFDFFDADRVAVLRKEDYIYLVLPMKI